MATKITIDGYDSYSGADIIVTAQLSYINNTDALSKKCYVLGSLQTISISTYQNKEPVRSIGNINALDYVMGPRTIAGSLVFAVFDRHFAYNIFNDLKEYSGERVLLTDEIPPLDITINFANEYGKRSKMTLYGVRMITEGQVMSVNDMFTENTYQFTALGLENLTPETESENNANFGQPKEVTIVSPTNIPFDDIDLSGYGAEYEHIDKDKLDKYNGNDNLKHIQILGINQPLTEDDYGTILVGVNDPNAIEIAFTNKFLNEEPIIYNASDFHNLNIWAIDAPIGTYNISVIDKNTKKELELAENINIYFTDTTSSIDDYPLIINITDTTIEMESNNYNHDSVTLLKDDFIIQTEKLNNNKYIFNNLLPASTYGIYTNNNEEKSKISYCVTLVSNELNKMNFKDYVYSNRKLWINDLSTFDFNTISSETFLDDILKSDYEYKDELLIYAFKYYNNFIKAANSKNDIITIDDYNNLHITDLYVNKSYETMRYFYTDNNKDYYIPEKEIESFTIPLNYVNKKCFTYAIDNNNIKSLRHMFYNYNDKSLNELKDYSFNDIDFNDFDYSNYQNNHPNMDNLLLETIILKDNNYPMLNKINVPKFDYDLTDEILTITIDCKELLEENKTYYFCILDKNDVLQNNPFVKIEFNSDTSVLILDKYKTHILKDKYYLIFVQDNNGNTISSSEILSTKSNNEELINYNVDIVKAYLKKLEKYILNIYSCKSIIETVVLTLLSHITSTKDILLYFAQELLNIGSQTIQFNNLDSIFYDILSYEYDNILYYSDVSYNNKSIVFNDDSLNIVTLDFYENETLPIKNVYYSNEQNIIDLNSNSYYTMVYAINKNTNNKTGFLLKNNIQNKIYVYKLNKK